GGPKSPLRRSQNGPVGPGAQDTKFRTLCPVGDEGHSTRLIEDNLPLVHHVVLQVAAHFPRYVDRHELARAGALGLVEAARRFDASRGVPFDRFAARRIRGAILDSVRATDWAPRSVRTLGRQLEQIEQKLASKR